MDFILVLFAQDVVHFCLFVGGIPDLCFASELQEVVVLEVDLAIAWYGIELDLEGTFKADIALVGDIATATPPLTRTETPPFQHFAHQ